MYLSFRRKEGVTVHMVVYPLGPPSDPGRECSGQGVVGVVVRTKKYERTEYRGRSDVTAQRSKCW
jgi:hypothetical protein